MFLVTNEKAYLCRKSAFAMYSAFVLSNLQQEMADRGIPGTCLARTDISRTYSAFHLRSSNEEDTDTFYGAQIYGHYYKSEAPSLTRKIRMLVKDILVRS